MRVLKENLIKLIHQIQLFISKQTNKTGKGDCKKKMHYFHYQKNFHIGIGKEHSSGS